LHLQRKLSTLRNNITVRAMPPRFNDTHPENKFRLAERTCHD